MSVPAGAMGGAPGAPTGAATVVPRQRGRMTHPVIFVIGVIILLVDIFSWIAAFVYIASCPAFSVCTLSSGASTVLVFGLVIGLIGTYYGWHGRTP